MDDLPGPEHSGNDQGFTHAAETANLPSGNSEASDPSQDDTSPEQITGTLTERHPDWPKIKLNVFLGFHATASDMEKMPQVVKGSQIYLYEDTSGNQATETLQNYANRTPEPAHFQADLEQTIDETNNNGESIRGSHWEAIVRSIYGTGVIVGHIDLRPGEETGDATIRNELDALINEPLNFTGSFDDRLTRLNERLHELSRLQRNREFGMLRRLETELETIFEQHPSLKDQDSIAVTYSLGSAHTPFVHKAREAGIDTTRTLAQKPEVYGYFAEALRVVDFGHEPSRELLAKAQLDLILQTKINFNAFKDLSGQDEDIYIRHLVDAFSIDEIENIDQRNASWRLRPETMAEMIAAKGLGTIPRNASELKTAAEGIRAAKHY